MRIAVCDSGLGGLDIAARLFRKGGSGELFYFNVWPEVDRGFGKMTPDERRQVWELAFNGIMQYEPDMLIIGCNTLSVVHRRSCCFSAPPVPVLDIAGAAVGVCGDFLRQHPDKKLLILGTAETVNSNCYKNMLIDSGIAPERIAGHPCPGVATLIEQDPASPDVEQLISTFAASAKSVLGDLSDHALGLCCTHFGYVPEMWNRCFAPFTLLNPNMRILENTAFPAGKKEIKITFISKIPLPESKIKAMQPLFADTPEISAAMHDYRYIPTLF